MGSESHAYKVRRAIRKSINQGKLIELFDYYVTIYLEYYDYFDINIDNFEITTDWKNTEYLYEDQWDLDDHVENNIALEATTLGFMWWYEYKKHILNEPSKDFDKLFKYCALIYELLKVKNRYLIDSPKRVGYFYSMAIHKRITKAQIAVLAGRFDFSPANLYFHYNEGRKRSMHKENKVAPYIIEQVKPLLKHLPPNKKLG